jgi:hypothetical protein
MPNLSLTEAGFPASVLSALKTRRPPVLIFTERLSEGLMAAGWGERR